MAVAQTFVNNTAEGCFVTSLDLYFSAKDSIQPITVSLVETYRSRPGSKIVDPRIEWKRQDKFRQILTR